MVAYKSLDSGIQFLMFMISVLLIYISILNRVRNRYFNYQNSSGFYNSEIISSMNRNILIAGATGFIGKHLVNAFESRGDMVYAVTRDPVNAKKLLPGIKKSIGWSDLSSLRNENMDAFINLSGMNLAEKRWNEKVKRQIYDSRVISTHKLIELISIMSHKPKVFISASGVDYYGDTGDKDVFEDSPPGSSFASRLTKDWESEALEAEQFGVRVVVLRTGLVIGKGSPALEKMLLPFKLFVGGPPGGGKQYLSWIHIDDLKRIYLFSLDNENVKGAVNASAPNPVTMRDFCKQLGRVLKRPSFFPVPGFLIRLFFGEIADVILSGRRALPRKLQDLEYSFKYTNVFDALSDIL